SIRSSPKIPGMYNISQTSFYFRSWMLFRAVAVVYAAREMRKPGTLVPDLFPSCEYVIPLFLALVKGEC
ncbi:MAG: hypothetical protein II038_06155, partial [Lachnospiraceae bacterium]|nr:hypothetical protein [Lachnospiraceae bacterium]